MTEYLTEQEQIEILKNWIKQYSFVILMGVLLSAIAITGWRYWQQRQYKMVSHASTIYNDMLMMRSQNNTQAVLKQANKLLTRYPQTTYAQFAHLILARQFVINHQYDKAEKNLDLVIKQTPIASLRQIARLRLARILLAQQKAETALNELKLVDDNTFIGLINEIRGDAYLDMHNTALARQSYKKALEQLPNAEVIRPVLRMKYDNLTTKI